jgi:hypothetical protein
MGSLSSLSAIARGGGFLGHRGSMVTGNSRYQLPVILGLTTGSTLSSSWEQPAVAGSHFPIFFLFSFFLFIIIIIFNLPTFFTTFFLTFFAFYLFHTYLVSYLYQVGSWLVGWFPGSSNYLHPYGWYLDENISKTKLPTLLWALTQSQIFNSRVVLGRYLIFCVV